MESLLENSIWRWSTYHRLLRDDIARTKVLIPYPKQKTRLWKVSDVIKIVEEKLALLQQLCQLVDPSPNVIIPQLEQINQYLSEVQAQTKL